ncbi:hypothetical protein F5888DRAFT_1711816 [Russula emetica]|nr:hypothetical protein F5888DRAFT_1711816 [Russula emetica]
MAASMFTNMADDPVVLFPRVPKEETLITCRQLSLFIHANIDDEQLRLTLDTVWFLVNQFLIQDKDLNRSLASLDEFKVKVNNRGEDSMFSLLRDMADVVRTTGSTTGWAPLFYDDVFYSAREDQMLYATEASLHATLHAWNNEFKGDAANTLFNSISDLLNPRAVAYARATCIINSSGTGKSRMVDEISMSTITVPMCLRLRGSQGFPPPDIILRDYFEEIGRPREQKRVKRALHGIVYGLLTITHAQLNSLPCDITLPADLPDEEYVTRVIERQQKLAFAFRDFMTRGQSFGTVNNDRQEFYRRVIVAAKVFDEECKSAMESITNSPPQYVDQDGKGVRTAGKALYKFVDPRELLKNEKRRPLILFSFDEPHVLTDGTKEGDWSLFSELCRILQRLDDCLFFSLFLSTAGNFWFLSPDVKLDPSSRIVNDQLRPFHPITEVSFDCLACPANEGSMTLNQVTQMDWIAHLGRPLFGSHFDGLSEESQEEDILRFAKQKLLNGKDWLEGADSSGSLACLATRFGLEFNNEDEDSHEVAFKQVERHMRICLAATTGFKSMVTCSPSEPLLAEAAFHLMSNTTASPVKHLTNHTNLYCVDRGRRGELVAALLIMQARDASLPRNLLLRRWVFVTDFMQALLPPQASELFLESIPTRWRRGEATMKLREKFANCRLWFNHIIKVEDSEVIRVEFLWMYITRGAMIVCKDTQQGIDIILPVSVSLDDNLSRQTVTAIVIQVKNATNFGLDVKNKLFNAMDPCRLGLLSDNPQPIIRMVFALASPEAGIRFPPRRVRETRYSDEFTSYDIWCAGLSTETFRQIGEDLDSYRKSLDRSQRDHEAFNVSESFNPLSENTKIIVGRTRRSMAPLIKSRGHNEIYHV